jgi:(p)ppGpp synthase/HD superfamily hydrolase
MTTEKYDRMCALVCEYHAHQSRNGGHVPYAQHCERVAHLLAFVLDKAGETTSAEREKILLAGLGHDLLEDTKIDPERLRLEFGEEVFAFISEVTNTEGDEHVSDYAEQLTTISDVAQLIKLADLTENALNASYAVHENGPEKTRYWCEVLMRPQYDVLRSRKCLTMPVGARLLQQFADYALKSMQYAVDRDPTY